MTQGQVVQCRFYTPGLKTGARYVVTEAAIGYGGPVMRVRPLADADFDIHWHHNVRYWAWRFAPYLGREQ